MVHGLSVRVGGRAALKGWGVSAAGTQWGGVLLVAGRGNPIGPSEPQWFLGVMEPGVAFKAVSYASALSAESGQSSGQFQGRPSEVWSQWQSQHHGQQSGEQHPHQQPGQTEVFQVNRASTAFS